MLSDLNYKDIYYSLEDNFDADFLIPCYSESNDCLRASGFFTLSSLVLSFDGLVKFVNNGGVLKLVCSPILSEQDVELINASLDGDTVVKRLLETLSKEDDEIPLEKLDIICNMISEGRLIIRIAYMPKGIFHEKFGVFSDNAGNKVAYSGSNNETLSAKIHNSESFEISQNWEGPKDCRKIQTWTDHFYKLWENRQNSVEVIDFPEAVKRELFSKYKKSETLAEAVDKYIRSLTTKRKKLYPFQEKAIEEFINNGYMHFYEMATGTGKTFTSVRTIERLYSEIREELFTVILVPLKDLQTQWKDSLEEDGLNNVRLLGGVANTSQTKTNIQNAVIDYFTKKELIICVSIYDTFFDKIYNQLSKIKNLFIIADEAHNLNPNRLAKLPVNARYRLGLSATIIRYDETESKQIVKYFTNDTIAPYYFGIEDAIANGFLSKYQYHPILVNLTEDEFEEYKYLSVLIANEANKEDPDMQKINNWSIERSLIVKQAELKTEKLKEMTESYNFKNSVVYCGQGNDEDEERIIDTVTTILNDSGLSVSNFTSRTQDRHRVLYEFENGYYDVLAAIKCFDEGVDVPKLDKIYIMASDASLRQTVQRRGRVLRKCKETNKQIAHIYDMITLPPYNSDSYSNAAKSLVRTEFQRAIEYNRLAENKEDVNTFFETILDNYSLTIKDIKDDTESN
jgi:superfamily II DNA or RNA helicase